MKTSLIISLLCFSALSSYAQSNDNEATERKKIHERAVAIYCETNGNMGSDARMNFKSNYSIVHATYPDAPANAVPAKPSTPYVAVQDPPCYKYKNKNGREVMECPGAKFTPSHCENPEIAENVIRENGNINVSKGNTYLGYYPDLHSLYPQAPANAVPAWPTYPYTQLQNPPCYKYINKRGLEVKECPGARFEPEHEYR